MLSKCSYKKRWLSLLFKMNTKNIKKNLWYILFSNIIFLNSLNAQSDINSINIKESFESEYAAYIEAKQVDNKEYPFRSTSYGPKSSVCLQNIAQLGVATMPYLIEKANETKDMSLNLPLRIITKKCFSNTEWPVNITKDSRGELKLYITWWESGRNLTPVQFSQYYSQWKEFKNNHKEKDAKDKLNEIYDLGIGALPMIMEIVRQGDTELIPIISKLTDDKIKSSATASECLSWWEKNKDDWLIPFPNKQPKANAGEAQTVSSSQNVQLDGSGSSDEDKDTLTYQWKQISGTDVKLSDANTIKPSFTAPKVDKETELVFELTVNDGSRIKQVHPSCESGQSKPGTVKITIKP